MRKLWLRAQWLKVVLQQDGPHTCTGSSCKCDPVTAAKREYLRLRRQQLEKRLSL